MTHTTKPKLTARRVVFEDLQFPACDLVTLMAEIVRDGRTGALTINFCSGVPLGTVEWKQKSTVPLDTLGDSIVELTLAG